MSTQTVSLKITLRYKDVDEFAKRYAENISSAGLFLRTRTPKPAGSKIRFELMLSDGNYVLRGDGVVVNIRQDDKPGMAIRFNVLDGESWSTVERVVAVHGNGSLAPTPLGAPFRSSSSSGSSSSRRTRTSLRAGGVGKGTGPIRSPFIKSASASTKAWSTSPKAKPALEEDANAEVQARPSMLARPWATGRNANIDTSEIRTSRMVKREAKESDKPELEAEPEAVLAETKKISPAEFLSRAAALAKKVSPEPEQVKSPLDFEKTRENVISLESDELVSKVQVRQTSDAGFPAIEPPSDDASEPESEPELEPVSDVEESSPEPESEIEENQEQISDNSLSLEEESAPKTSDLEAAKIEPHYSEEDFGGGVDVSTSDLDVPENIAQLSADNASEIASSVPMISAVSEEEEPGFEDDWASAFDDYADSSLPTKVISPADPTQAPTQNAVETELLVDSDDAADSEGDDESLTANEATLSADSDNVAFDEEFVLGEAMPSFEDIHDDYSEEDLVSVPSEELASSDSEGLGDDYGNLGDPAAPPLSEALESSDESDDLSQMKIVTRETGDIEAYDDSDENPALDGASDSELFGVVDSLFETESQDQPLPKLRASVSPEALDSPPMVDAVIAAAEAEEKEVTNDYVSPSSVLPEDSQEEASDEVSGDDENPLAALLQTRPVRDESELEASPPNDFALYSNVTAINQEAVPVNPPEESADDLLRAFVEEADGSEDLNPDRLSVDDALSFAEGNVETAIDGSADEYLSNLSAPDKIESIAPATNLVSEITPNRPISAETVADPAQDHWTPSEIERGYAVDISSHVGTARPASAATVAIDLGGQWLRVGTVTDGALIPIPIDGLTHYPGLIGLYDNYEVAQGAELLNSSARRPAEIASIMQLLRGVQGEPFASRENAEKVRVEADGRCTTDLLGRKWNLTDLLNAFWAPIGFCINQHQQLNRSKVLLIVPAGTGDLIKSLLTQACDLSDLEVEGFVEDNHAFVSGSTSLLSGHENALFIDFGETHLNVCLASKDEHDWNVRSSKWDANVSCREIDERIARLVVSEIGDEWSNLSSEQKEVLYKSVSAIRSDTRKDPSVEFQIPAQENLEGQTISLARTRVYQATEEFIDRAIMMARGMLNDFSIHPKSVGAIVLLGGAASYQPLVSGMTTIIGKTPLTGVNPDTVFLAGALGLSPGPTGQQSQSPGEVLSSSIGIALPGGRFKALVESGTTLPTRVVRRNPTTKDNQSEFELELFQGESASVSDCLALGRVVLSGLPKGARGQVFVDLEISVQRNGVTTIQLSEPKSAAKEVATVWTEQTPMDARQSLEEEMRLAGDSSDKPKSRKSLLGRLFGR